MTDSVKDDQRERPVPDVWQPTISATVESLAREDAVIAAELPPVDPVPLDLSDGGGYRYAVTLVYVP